LALNLIDHFWVFGDVTVYQVLKGIIKKKYGQDACNVGDEGGFAPNIQDNREGLILLVDAIEKAGYTGKVKIGMDVAASEFLTKDGLYDLDFKEQPNDGSKKLTAQALGDLYKEFVRDFPIVSIEDPYDQDDWSAWASLQAGINAQIVGDDLLVTNSKKIKEAIKTKACNALLLKVLCSLESFDCVFSLVQFFRQKLGVMLRLSINVGEKTMYPDSILSDLSWQVNQIGSVTESIQAALDSKAAGWGVMVSHRSGETEDTFIADLAVGLASGQVLL
jgi:enolase